MLFAPRPKLTREELYDREEELRKLLIADTPIVLLLAPRRLGKTSLLNVFASEIEERCVILDCRAFFHEQNYSSKLFVEKFLTLIDQLARKTKLLKGMRRRKVSLKSIQAYGVELGFESESSKELIGVLLELNKRAEAFGKSLVIAFDEAQMLRFLRRPGGLDFPLLLAFAYDRLMYLQFVLTGSEVGVLRDFLNFDDPSSPLYGRSVLEVTLPRFTRDQSIDFLKKGFSEIGMNVSEELIERAVSKLDGVVGWLTAFGYRCYIEGKVSDEVLERTVSEAQQAVIEELQQVLRYSENFKYVLKAIAQGSSSWKAIKEGAEFLARKRMTDTSFNRLLTNLVRMGYVAKDALGSYGFEDPIVADVAKTL